ncbi:hypothetical protein [Sphingopyxis solisilvae]|uniref:hypothetical protein n=1 Tax=Sphingopyxis solisilvae TaxID=1886788 RepID=UPI001892AB2C|nr:hypothetical protein [Sphingopyxis solisilvae]
MRFAYLIPPMMLLAACGSEEKKADDSTEVSINAGDKGGGIQIKSGADGGKLKIDAGGVNIGLDIPNVGDLDIGQDFDIDGVGLYPGSKITSMDIDARDKNGRHEAKAKFGFTTPAAPAIAADWMAGEFAKKGIKVTRTGDAIAGTAKDGDNFMIRFNPDGKASKGEVLISKS